ncbi:MAG: hypothetical protein H8E82_01970 [Candidatus Marinimicrobia bacterium]|nr:hypothetical protein [Candidatus Neomarinimicrobiota bacterium]MBL7046602.1 hypothetical protein [Candidatus Neomarinimicrobiota bacterium]
MVALEKSGIKSDDFPKDKTILSRHVGTTVSFGTFLTLRKVQKKMESVVAFIMNIELKRFFSHRITVEPQ